MPITEAGLSLSFTVNFNFPEIARFGGLVWCRDMAHFKRKVRHDWLGFVALGDAAGDYGSDQPVVAFGAVYLAREMVTVTELVVDPGRRRRGIGSAIIRSLIARKLSPRRPYLAVNVPETNLPAQLMLKNLGIRCDQTIPGFYGRRTLQLEPRGLLQLPHDALRFLFLHTEGNPR